MLATVAFTRVFVGIFGLANLLPTLSVFFMRLILFALGFLPFDRCFPQPSFVAVVILLSGCRR